MCRDWDDAGSYGSFPVSPMRSDHDVVHRCRKVGVERRDKIIISLARKKGDLFTLSGRSDIADSAFIFINKVLNNP